MGAEYTTLRSIVLPKLTDMAAWSIARTPNLTELHVPLLRKRLRGESVFLNVPGITACDAERLAEELCADGSQGVEPMATGGCRIAVDRCSTDPGETACAQPCRLSCGEGEEDIWHCPEGVGPEADEARTAPRE